MIFFLNRPRFALACAPLARRMRCWGDSTRNSLRENHGFYTLKCRCRFPLWYRHPALPCFLLPFKVSLTLPIPYMVIVGIPFRVTNTCRISLPAEEMALLGIPFFSCFCDNMRSPTPLVSTHFTQDVCEKRHKQGLNRPWSREKRDATRHAPLLCFLVTNQPIRA